MLAATTSVAEPALRLLGERAIDAVRLGPLAEPAAANLALALEGGAQHLVVVTVPAGPEDDGRLAALAGRLAVVAAQPTGLPGQPWIAILAVADTAPNALLAGWPGAGVHKLDGQSYDHPWARAAAKPPRASREPDDNQVRVPVEILDRLFGRIGEFFTSAAP